MHQTGKESAAFKAQIQFRPLVGRRTAWAAIAVTGVSALFLAGCGNNYRPVVSAINPVGPAGQPAKYAVAVSNPTDGNSLVTFVDFSGDTVLATPSLFSSGAGVSNPVVQNNASYFALGNSGSSAYVINPAGSLDTFSTGNPTTLITSNVSQTTLLAGSNPVSITPIAGTGAGTIIFVPQPGSSSVAALSSNGPSLLQNLSVGANPDYVVGTDSSPRVYALSTGTGAGPGQAAAIETTTSLPTISATLPVGTDPVYGVMSADATRAFILNRGSGNVSVINVHTNALDLTTPTIPATGTLGTNPVWAVLVPRLAELLVLNQGDGTTPGSLSIISIPLCNSVTPVTNPNCNQTNPADAAGFGTVEATVPLGINPVMVDVLSDASRAYVANQGNAAAGVAGSVSVVNLTSNIVTATIPAGPDPATTNTTPASFVYGHPNSISVTLASPTGKAYVTSGDGHFLTVIETDTDTVDTHVDLQGLGVRVLVNAP